MRRRPIPFKFKVLRPDSGAELIYLPKLGDPLVERLVARLKGLGFDEPKVINMRPKVLKIPGAHGPLRLMPRGLLIGPPGTFERFGSSLDFELGHAAESTVALSWAENDYHSLVSVPGGLALHVRGRHTPPQRRFSAEVSRMGSALSADEALMILSTIEACRPQRVELLTSSPGISEEMSGPIRLEAKGFLHHAELEGDTFLSKSDEIVSQCLGGPCPFSPLADSTVRLKGASLPLSSEGLEDVAAILENWVSDRSYFAAPIK